MRTLKVRGSVSNVNWYVKDTIKVTGIEYKILDADYYQLEDIWILKVKRKVE